MWIPKKSNEEFRLPDSVQMEVPILAWHPNGIFEHNREYSISCRFTDIESAASDEDWKHLEEDRFDWWVGRFRRLTELVDIVRIDHFRGFQAYWQVPHGETTAVNGEWVDCP